MFSVRPIKLRCDVLKSVLAAVVILGLSACGVPQKLRPYSIDIRQGNYVTQEMVSQLSPGMTQDQVRFIMGSPLLVDPFHANRWDYVYSFAPQGKVSERRRITVLFKDGKLSSVDGDVVAAIAPTAQSTPRATP